jgi:hypothetical protein
LSCTEAWLEVVPGNQQPGMVEQMLVQWQIHEDALQKNQELAIVPE